jgi:probable rRNA maturation factor
MGRRDHNSRSEQPTWGIHLVAGLGSQTPPSGKMNITVANRQHVRKINLRLLKKFANALLAELDIEKAEIGICLVGAPEMTRLNETFIKHKGSTDVIAFDYRDNVGQASRLSHSKIRKVRDRQDACPTLHGEIFVCVDEAVLQARKFDTSWQSEIVRYIIHGVLHLVGFDDSSAGARRKMKREENRRLREITRCFPLSKL